MAAFLIKGTFFLPLFLLLAFSAAVFIGIRNLWRYWIYRRAGGHSLSKILFDKGAAGEYRLYRKLCRVHGHKALHPNLYLVRRGGEITETDMVMIHTSGIYIFEMKNYGGAVYGSPSAKEWTQVFGKNKKSRFYNPLLQNQIHQRAIKTALEMENDLYFHVFAVFSDDCRLSVKPIPKNLLPLKALMREIRKIIRELDGILSPQRVDQISSTLTALNRNNPEIRQRHIQNTANNHTNGGNTSGR